MILIFASLIIYNYLHPRFPDYNRESYQFIQESYRRPREFERYCRNLGATPSDLRTRAQAIFDDLPMLEKISMWEMLDQTLKGQLEKKMTAEEKEALKKHIEDVERVRRMRMATQAIGHVIHGPHPGPHGPGPMGPPGFGPRPW